MNKEQFQMAIKLLGFTEGTFSSSGTAKVITAWEHTISGVIATTNSITHTEIEGVVTTGFNKEKMQFNKKVVIERMTYAKGLKRIVALMKSDKRAGHDQTKAFKQAYIVGIDPGEGWNSP